MKRPSSVFTQMLRAQAEAKEKKSNNRKYYLEVAISFGSLIVSIIAILVSINTKSEMSEVQSLSKEVQSLKVELQVLKNDYEHSRAPVDSLRHHNTP